VPNTKVIPNILIYLHAKFHIFLRYLNISFYSIFSSARNFKWKRNSEKGNSSQAVFLCAGLHLQCLGPSPPMSRPASHYRAAVTDRWGPPIGAVLPQFLPYSVPACHRRPNSHRRAGHTSRHCRSHRITSSCHVASRRRCPLVGCRPSMRQPGCPS
jgi:hypothetical protein